MTNTPANLTTPSTAAELPGRGNYRPTTPHFQPAEAKSVSRVSHVPGELELLTRGEMCMALGLGLAPAEAEAWFGLSEGAIDRLLVENPELAEEVASAADLALVHCLLQIQQAAGRSWRAAKWLSAFLAARRGNYTADELRGMFPNLTWNIRCVLYAVQRATEAEERRTSP